MARSHILLVGGNPLVAAMLTEHLHDDRQYEVESVAYCDHALAMLQRRPFDLVLVLSVYVPWTMWPRAYSAGWHAAVMTAMVFLKHMRMLPNPPPVIVVSGSPLAMAKEEALAHGAFAFIRNPVALAELDRVVELALEKGSRKQ